jgi:hypothetical protein
MTRVHFDCTTLHKACRYSARARRNAVSVELMHNNRVRRACSTLTTVSTHALAHVHYMHTVQRSNVMYALSVCLLYSVSSSAACVLYVLATTSQYRCCISTASVCVLAQDTKLK